jgi:2-phospho-L-lactate guanylyltransferase (CobY/MobA/RfbA family)
VARQETTTATPGQEGVYARLEDLVALEYGVLNEALKAAERICPHDFVVAIVSDFDGLDDETEKRVTRLARHNDVIALPVWAP